MRMEFTRKFLVLLPILTFAFTANAKSEFDFNNNRLTAIRQARELMTLLNKTSDRSRFYGDLARLAKQHDQAGRFHSFGHELISYSSKIEYQLVRLLERNINPQILFNTMRRLDTVDFSRVRRKFDAIYSIKIDLRISLVNITMAQNKLKETISNIGYPYYREDHYQFKQIGQIGQEYVPELWECIAAPQVNPTRKYSAVDRSRSLAHLQAQRSCENIYLTRCVVLSCSRIR